MVLRKGGHIIGQMANVSHHSTCDRPSGSNHNICYGAIKGTIPQPYFWWKLQGSTHKVSNNIGVTDNNFKFMSWSLFLVIACCCCSCVTVLVLLVGPFFYRQRRWGPVKVFLEGLLNPGMMLIGCLNRFVGCLTSGNVMTWPV